MTLKVTGSGITDVNDNTLLGVNSDGSVSGVMGRKNLIINGAMQVAQRGTSFTDSDTYSLDRWRLNVSSETMAVSQQSFTSGQTDVPRAEKYLRVVITTTGNFAGITQRIEGVEQLSGQTVTLSFYARGGQGGQGVPTTFRTYLNQNFGSGGSAAVNAQGITNHTLTTSWQLFTATVTLGSTSGKTVGTSSYTELVFQQTTGEACDFDIALVQLEVGSVATDFEHRSYGDELALCQRYYRKLYLSQFTTVIYRSNGDTRFTAVPIGNMRSTPTVSPSSFSSHSISNGPSGIAVNTPTVTWNVTILGDAAPLYSLDINQNGYYAGYPDDVTTVGAHCGQNFAFDAEL